jgi:hypothetical protein
MPVQAPPCLKRIMAGNMRQRGKDYLAISSACAGAGLPPAMGSEAFNEGFVIPCFVIQSSLVLRHSSFRAAAQGVRVFGNSQGDENTANADEPIRSDCLAP